MLHPFPHACNTLQHTQHRCTTHVLVVHQCVRQTEGKFCRVRAKNFVRFWFKMQARLLQSNNMRAARLKDSFYLHNRTDLWFGICTPGDSLSALELTQQSCWRSTSWPVATKCACPASWYLARAWQAEHIGSEARVQTCCTPSFCMWSWSPSRQLCAARNTLRVWIYTNTYIHQFATQKYSNEKRHACHLNESRHTCERGREGALVHLLAI